MPRSQDIRAFTPVNPAPRRLRMKRSCAAGFFLVVIFFMNAGAPCASAQADKKDVILKDAHGDPLPKGARLRLGSERFRCLASVRDIAISPNGKWLAVSTFLGHFALFDAATGQKVGPLNSG